MIAVAKQSKEYQLALEEIMIPSNNITPGKSYEVIEIIYHSDNGDFVYTNPTYNNVPNHRFCWFKVTNDLGNKECVWASFFTSREDLIDYSLQQIGIV